MLDAAFDSLLRPSVPSSFVRPFARSFVLSLASSLYKQLLQLCIYRNAFTTYITITSNSNYIEPTLLPIITIRRSSFVVRRRRRRMGRGRCLAFFMFRCHTDCSLAASPSSFPISFHQFMHTALYIVLYNYNCLPSLSLSLIPKPPNLYIYMY